MSETRPLPLKGIKVLDMGNYVAGPAAATIMGDFGAEVIKIEPPGLGDYYRYTHLGNGMPKSDESYQWTLTNRNKKSLALDLKHPEGYATLLELIKQVDIVVTNFRPALLDRLKVDYNHLSEHNPQLIYGHLTGYGKHGDDANTPAFDRTAGWARAGIMDASRPSDESPRNCLPGIGDHPTALSLFGGVMMALYERSQTGVGSEIHTSLTATGAYGNGLTLQGAISGATQNRADGIADTPNAFLMAYQTKDQRWFWFWLETEESGPSLITAMIDEPSIMQDQRFLSPEGRQRHAADLKQIIQHKIAQQDFAHWQSLMDSLSIRYVTSSTLSEVLSDPQMNDNGVFPTFTQAVGKSAKTVSSPMEIIGRKKKAVGPPPGVGEHSIEILRDCGLSDKQIQSLIEQDIVSVEKLDLKRKP